MTDQADTHCDGEPAFREQLPDESVVIPTVQLLKGFADETRLRILCLLRGREVCVHEIGEESKSSTVDIPSILGPGLVRVPDLHRKDSH